MDHALIRQQFTNGKTQSEIAKEYGVSRQRINQIITGRKCHEFRNIILARADFKCQAQIVCDGQPVRRSHLETHHIDLNPQNSVLSNLQCVCRKCHKAIHSAQTLKDECTYCGDRIATKYRKIEGMRVCQNCYDIIKPIVSARWSKNYDKCIDCGTTTRAYGARGRCQTCRDRYLYAISPTRRMQVQISNKKWAQKNPDKVRAINLKANKNWIKNNPDKHKARCKATYERIKADPERYERAKINWRKACAKYNAKKRAEKVAKLSHNIYT